MLFLVRRHPLTFFRTSFYAMAGYVPAAIIGGATTDWGEKWLKAQVAIGLLLVVILILLSIMETRWRWQLFLGTRKGTRR
jgi:undecaprenyl pyrophosphate phosphatase UppP